MAGAKEVNMAMAHGNQQGRSMAARRDMALVAVISLAAAIICVRFDLSEALLSWTRLHERLQVDELPGVLLVFATCLIWFAMRRYLETLAELKLRRAVEGKLAEVLAENRRLAQQYLDMQECERKALARDLHDELGQYLNVIKLDAVSMRDAHLAKGTLIPAAVRALIENVDRVYAVVGSLIRHLRPVGFDDLGVAAALEHCVDEWRGRLPAARIELVIDADIGTLDEMRSMALFRLVQEALTNVARHSQASSVEIRIGAARAQGAPETVTVSVADDGRGVDIDAPRSGLGLVGMRERIAAFGGSLHLASRPGRGFRINASLPLAASPVAARQA